MISTLTVNHPPGTEEPFSRVRKSSSWIHSCSRWASEP
jgi:hypothetical protein